MTIRQKEDNLFSWLRSVNTRLQHSITKKMLIMVFSLYFILTVVVTVVHMNFEYQVTKDHTIATLKSIQAMQKDSLSQAIWEFNPEQVDAILAGITTNTALVGLELVLVQDKTITELIDKKTGLINGTNGELVYIDPQSLEAKPVENSFEKLIPYTFNIYHENSNKQQELIGKMTLYSSNKVVFDQVKASFLLLIINAIIKTVALWIFFLWAGNKYISKPLDELMVAIHNLAAGNWNNEELAKYKHEKHKTEINALISAFNEMTIKLYVAQQRIEASRNKLNNIFDTMPSALIFIDHNTQIQGWNKCIAQQTGINSETAINQRLLDIYPQFSDYNELIKTALHDKKQQQIINAKLISKPEDVNRIFNIQVFPIITGHKIEAVIRIDDVTDKVKSEANLAQVEKLASVGALIAGVAHEINNPLGSIMQGTQNVIRRLDPSLDANIAVANEIGLDLEMQHSYLEKREINKFLVGIREAGERASSIVKNMLKFTRRSTDEMQPYNLIEIINDAIQLASTDYSLQERTDFKKIMLTKEFSSEQVMIACSPMEIQQVVLNLLKNAAQALESSEGEKRINIQVSQLSAEKVQITISDNGPGIPAENLDQIFQPFFTTKAIGQGTGLGLSVCRNIIVQKHHGTMEVNSTVNVGTNFIIILPVKQLS